MVYFSLTAAAREIGICRAWLYRKYLPRYVPKNVGGSPKLTEAQVARIKIAVSATRNGKSNGKRKGK